MSEFWPGWFDEWHDRGHHRYSIADFDHELEDILFRVNGSVNFYMFIGGTNFGKSKNPRKPKKPKNLFCLPFFPNW